MIKSGTTVIIRKPGHWANGETGIVSVCGQIGAKVQMSSCQGSVTLAIASLEEVK